MAQSPAKEGHSLSETLNPSDQNPTSTSPAPAIPNCITDDQPSSDPPPSDDATVSGEKRKREDTEDPDPDPNTDAAHHPLWKTSLCSYFRRDSGSCSHGDACRYAHGEAELRIRPDNTWDPTSERAKKLRREENRDGDESKGLEDERNEVMMTELVAGGDDDEDGDCDDVELSKCIVHLPRKWSSDHLRKFLEEQGIAYKSAKKKKGMVVGFVNFEDVEQLKTAVEELQEKSVGSKMMKIADVIPRPFEKKVKQGLQFRENSHQSGESPSYGELNTNNCSINDASLADPSGKVKSARDVVTPLAHMSYADQLEHKKNSLVQMLKKLTRNARKACPNGVSLPDWILKSREIGGLPCMFEGVIESPRINGYRNKCEFSVGYSVRGKPTVGFMLGNFREGVTAVEEPGDCTNVSRMACKYASIFQEFLQSSELPIWNRFKNTGFWRQLTVREGRKPSKALDVETCETETNIAEVMIIVQVSSAGFDNAIVASEFERMAKAIAEGATASNPPLPLTTLVIQDHQGISNVAPADAPLRCLPITKLNSSSPLHENNSEEPRIHDYISNLQFSISPTAFFQVNTLAAEKLYSLAGNWAALGPDTLLFDVCCGTGTIGLTLAHHVGMVIGIEINASAVVDAHRNAEINGITNCKFVCAKAEDVMGSLLKEYLQMLPEKGDESADACQCSSTETISAEKNGYIVDVMPNTNNSNKHNPENNQGASTIEEEGLGSQDQEGGTVEVGKSPKRLFKNVVAIVDPPRGGLHPTVIKVLRTHSRLRKLVYISCNPESLVANAIELCTPSPENNDKGKKDNRAWRNMSSTGLARHRVKSMPNSEPFCPVKAVAVDLFPHTPHCEMVMLLER